MIREALHKDISVMEKSSPVDLVTETDQRVEQLIISSIKEKFPAHRCPGDVDSDPSPVGAHAEPQLLVATITTPLFDSCGFVASSVRNLSPPAPPVF